MINRRHYPNINPDWETGAGSWTGISALRYVRPLLDSASEHVIVPAPIAPGKSVLQVGLGMAAKAAHCLDQVSTSLDANWCAFKLSVGERAPVPITVPMMNLEA